MMLLKVALDVCFVVMPFGSVHRPALGVSLLKSALQEIGVSAEIYYFNILFAEKIGLDIYDKLSESSHLIGEFIFSRSAFGRKQWDKNDLEGMLHTIFPETPAKYLDSMTNEIMMMREYISVFLKECVIRVLGERPKLIGFTSVFHQHCASIALARELKEESDTPIIFGGANCEGEMGSILLKSVPYVDFVCSGEGDIAFLQFVKSFLIRKNNENINGIITRNSNIFDIFLTNPVMNMDLLPISDFDDYFAALSENSFEHNFSSECLLETSRGCWWGEKFQCTFCGLNGSNMSYRSKSVPRVLFELQQLIIKYKKRDICVVDNIMDLNYINSLFPEIARQKLNVKLFYETKSNISKDQLSLMKEGGVSRIQPGIESLSDIILKIMKKGVSALQNIQLLKWCREFKITPYWNLLYGFPGEPEIEYKKMAKIVPLITHLYPPTAICKIVLDRFSPYFVDPFSNGIMNVRPIADYTFVYPFSEEQIRKIAYHFDFDYLDGRDILAYTKDLEKLVYEWINSWKGRKIPVLLMSEFEDGIVIFDTRACAIQRLQMLDEKQASLYKICRVVHSLQSILHKYKESFHRIPEDKIYDALQGLVDNKLMLRDNERYLSLAVEINQKSQ